MIVFNGNTVSYDMDGNMLSNGYINCEFDSGNRLISAGGHTYTYNAEDVRIRNLCSDADTTYTYNTNCRLSQLLQKTTNGITTKYVYGLGLIGEEKCGEFKTYHFDYRGSTVAITDEDGNIIDTFKYDTYGNVTEHIGNSAVIFGYNGRDGVVTDENGLIYMRARYYSPKMRRFVNADILHGEISDSTSLNRYSYVNGNPVSFVDPFGLEASRGGSANQLVFSGLQGLYDLAYNYYSYVKIKKDRISFANDAVMKFIFYKRFYNSSAHNLAWGEIAGTLDYGVLAHLESCEIYNYMQDDPKFYDPFSGNEIDFVHMIGTLNANTFDRPGLGWFDKPLNDYAGWAGDLITLAGDVQNELNMNPDLNVSLFVQDALSKGSTSFSNKDFLADIDAVLLSDLVSSKPIYEAFNEYYSSDTSKRAGRFVEQEFDAWFYLAEKKAKEYLSPGLFTNIFKSKFMFDVNYNKNIIDDVATGFMNYLIFA